MRAGLCVHTLCLALIFAPIALTQVRADSRDPLQAWGRAFPPKGLWEGQTSEKKTVVYLVRVNNLLAEEPTALEGYPEAAQKINELILEHQDALVQRGVRTRPLIKLLGLPKPVALGMKASSAEKEKDAAARAEFLESQIHVKQDLENLSQQVADLLESQSDFGNIISTFVQKQQELRQALENLSASENKLAGQMEAMRERMDLGDDENQALAKKQKEFGTFHKGVLEFQEGVRRSQTETLSQIIGLTASLDDLKTGLASQGVLLERISKDIDRLESQSQTVEGQLQKTGADYDALRQLLRVSQSGTSDLREDVAVLTQRMARIERLGESSRSKRGRKLLESKWLAPAALGVGMIAIILAL